MLHIIFCIFGNHLLKCSSNCMKIDCNFTHMYSYICCCFLSKDHTCRLVDCDGEVSQWTTDDLKQYCILKDAARISCLDVTLLYRVITCNVPGSYGYSNDILPAAIWVRNDCYAQFKVCYTTGKHGHFVRYI